MSNSSKMKLIVHSKRWKRYFEVEQASEFDIDLDLDSDADAFDLVLENTDGIYTGVFCRFDFAWLYINGVLVLEGNIDKVTYYLQSDKDYVRISGRDKMWKFIDNDALPTTLINVNPKKYIIDRCKKYGITFYKVSKADTYNKLVIGNGETEMSVMNNLLLDSKQRIWFQGQKLYTGNWATDADVDENYIFTLGDTDIYGTKAISGTLEEDGTDMRSHIVLYGSDSDGSVVVKGEYKNSYLIKRGVKKRSVQRKYSDSAAIKYTAIAEKNMRKTFRDNVQLTIVVPMNNDITYTINKVSRVIIPKLGIDYHFFVKGVNYHKTFNDGGLVTFIMIPADSLFEDMWSSSTGISITELTEKSLAFVRSYNKSSISISDNISSDTSISAGVGESETSNSQSGTYFPACDEYSGASFTDGLKSIGAKYTTEYKRSIASANGISDYTGSASQTKTLLGLLKSGKLIRP